MITKYKLPNTGEERTIEHKYTFNDNVLYVCPNLLEVECVIKSIYVTYNGIYYMTNKFKEALNENSFKNKE